MHKVGDIICDYTLTEEDVQFLNSKARENLICKANLLGLFSNLIFNEDYTVIKAIRGGDELVVLPDIAIAISCDSKSFKEIGHDIGSDLVLKKLVLNQHLRVLDENAFSSLTINNLELNEGLRVISNYSLMYHSFSKLVIPSSLVQLHPYSLVYSFDDECEMHVKSLALTVSDIIKALGDQARGTEITLILPPEMESNMSIDDATLLDSCSVISKVKYSR